MERNRSDDDWLAIRLGRNLGASHSGREYYQRANENSCFRHFRASAISVATNVGCAQLRYCAGQRHARVSTPGFLGGPVFIGLKCERRGCVGTGRDPGRRVNQAVQPLDRDERQSRMVG